MYLANQAIVGGVTMPLTPQPTWNKVAAAIDFTYFAALSLTSTIALFALPPRGIIHGIKIKHSQSFSGGGITAYTVSVGILGNLAKLASAFDVFQPVASNTLQLSSNFDAEDDSVSTIIYATATSVSAQLMNATQGVLDIWALLSSSTR